MLRGHTARIGSVLATTRPSTMRTVTCEGRIPGAIELFGVINTTTILGVSNKTLSSMTHTTFLAVSNFSPHLMQFTISGGVIFDGN